ncbi:LOW QUALITY PROTEIN: alpha-(1,3)-fucosyltransferase 10-like [Patiria miniata]|uniref:GDP-fucose protein O-fucosyltransferase n=1 Tax=Patiria miniata TaxID=46514 RepID=A0A914ADN0_PATMI|nr:LOW QUALITY PROTEIN: alpha-(1,3)-fucosyltransferase 10-like [Patiria miniata]
MFRLGRCRLRKFLALIFVIFCVSVCILFLVLQSFDEEDFYWDDGAVDFQQQFQLSGNADYGGNIIAPDGTDQHTRDHVNVTNIDVRVPIILWWTPFTAERGKVKACGENKCFFTVDRHFKDHPKTKVFLFYGTDFVPRDLPLPRKKHHEWALLHEESPKNNYMLSHEECLTLFNHTSTFKRESDFPLTTQYLESLSDLTSTKYLVPTEYKSVSGLAPVVYIHSDCDPPSDRDRYVKELMKYIRVDSYGKCLHNKDLPVNLVDPLTMHNKGLYKILARYKFNLAFENAICNDYITEKFWRPLMLGSVPVYRGSPTVRDWLPDNQSAIIADDFPGPKELADYLNYLDSNNEAYENFLNFKKVGVKNRKLVKTMEDREWGVNDYNRPNFIDEFECFACRRVHENLKRASLGVPLKTFQAKKDHYDCPRPRTYNDQKYWSPIELYLQMYDRDKNKAKALRKIVLEGRNFSVTEFNELVSRETVGYRDHAL